MENVIRDHLEIKNTEIIANELLTSIRLTNLSQETLDRLIECRCITKEQAALVRANGLSSASTPQEAELSELMVSAIRAFFDEKMEEALVQLNEAIKINPDNQEVWFGRGASLMYLAIIKKRLQVSTEQ